MYDLLIKKYLESLYAVFYNNVPLNSKSFNMAMNAYDKYGPSCSDLFHVSSRPQRLRFCGTEITNTFGHVALQSSCVTL